VYNRIWGEHIDFALFNLFQGVDLRRTGPVQGLLSSGEVSGVCSSGLVEVLAALVYEQFEVRMPI